MTRHEQKELGKALWAIADKLRGAMNADDFRDYMLSFLFLRYLSDNYEAATSRELGSDWPALAESDKRSPLAVWHEQNSKDIEAFEKQMRRKVHMSSSRIIYGAASPSWRAPKTPSCCTPCKRASSI